MCDASRVDSWRTPCAEGGRPEDSGCSSLLMTRQSELMSSIQQYHASLALSLLFLHTVFSSCLKCSLLHSPFIFFSLLRCKFKSCYCAPGKNGRASAEVANTSVLYSVHVRFEFQMQCRMSCRVLYQFLQVNARIAESRKARKISF
jgi:hypothetical protein